MQAREHPANGHRTTRRDQIRQGRAEHREILTTKRRLLKMIVSTLQPLESTEDTNFLDFVKALNPSLQIPTKSVIRSQLLSIYSEEEKKLRSVLASAADVVLTCELWSSRAEDPYLTVACHFVDIHGNLKSYMLRTASLFGDDSAANIQKQLLAVMESWCVKDKVHTVIRAGMPQLKNIKTKWTHMPCFADTLNVVFRDLMSDGELLDVLRKCQNIIRFFQNDSEVERKLREIQERLDMEQDELIMYSGDRWLPWLQMLQRLMQQYEAMVMVLDKRGKTDLLLNENEKNKINKIISALTPLMNATSSMKGGFQTISAMLPLLKKLMDSLREEKRNNDVAQKLLSKCKMNFGDINNHVLAPTTFLDPRFKNQLGDQNKKQAMDQIKKKLAAGPASPSAAELNDVLDRYIAYEPTAEASNPLSWWRYTGKKNFGELSELALKDLGVVSTAVPLERAFSSAGDQFCNLRRSIDPENLNMILFLNSNWSSKP
ncbi:E3 SUMO-protein ligase ZBED1-like [Chaetodon trifascialis]|uniref:E3 SUMO-protein ligase ZBED1-like n=1 Tax=Chaetodon trifascialis TaxID=109706 RepID=UPI003992140D